MNSGSKTPKAPNPVTVANAQTGSNQSTAMFENMLNMQDQRTPYGSLTWQSAGTWQYKDPSTGKMVTVPKFMASSVLSPAQQGLLDQEQQFDARYNQMAIDQAGRVKDTLSNPFKYSPGEHEKWAGDIYNRLNADSIKAGEDELRQSLANRGLNIGTEAYDRALRNFYQGNQNARDQFMLDSYGTGMNTALTVRNQPLKEGIALMGGGQITEPSWLSGPQSGVANTDVAGIYGQNYAQKAAAAQQQAQASAGMWGALGQLGGAALGGWLASDKRVKKGLQKLGKDSESGLEVSRWQYDGGEQTHETPMAQDVERKYPRAVREFGGVKHVDWKRVPGGRKFLEDTARDPAAHTLGQEPDAQLLRKRNMTVPSGDPGNNIRDALPKAKYQEARGRRRGLQRLGARSVA